MEHLQLGRFQMSMAAAGEDEDGDQEQAEPLPPIFPKPVVPLTRLNRKQAEAYQAKVLNFYNDLYVLCINSLER